MQGQSSPMDLEPIEGVSGQLLEWHPDHVPLTTGQAGRQLPFQRWFPFKEAFAPQFVADVLARDGRGTGTLLDPFGGSGTSALTAQHLGWNAHTIEVNPFLADLIQAKLHAYDVAQLRRNWSTILARVGRARPSLSRLYAQAPRTLVEPGEADRWVFSAAVLRRVAAYRQTIEALPDAAMRRFFRVQLGAILVPLSHVVISGKGRRYRRGWQQLNWTGADVDARLARAVDSAIADVAAARPHAGSRCTVARGDARALLADAPVADCALFSPPYPNSFDYTDIYNLELWVLGYLNSKDDNRRLRHATVQSHVQLIRTASPPPDSPQLTRCLQRLARVRDQLWSPHIPAMVGSYFHDLAHVLHHVAWKVTPGGRVVVVVGDSRYEDVYVDVAAILQELAPACGLRVTQCEAMRSMRVSPQQGGQPGLTETAITFTVQRRSTAAP